MTSGRHILAHLLPSPLDQWAGEASVYPRDKTIAELFEAVVRIHPHCAALHFQDSDVTYADLNRRANLLANRLIRLGVNPGSLVGLCAERSIEMVVGLLAILKSGAAYVPIDPSYPADRIQFIVGDASVSVMLVQNSFAGATAHCRSTTVVFIDEEISEPSANQDNPKSSADAESLAYVMYTSGSTGRPKGVMVENRSVVRLVCNTNYCRFGPDHVFLQLAPISFDASTFEIWGALLHGAKLVIAPPHTPSLDEIGELIRKHRISTMWLTAGLFHLFVDQRLDDLQPLQQLLAGGDVLSAPHVRKVLQRFPHLTLINGYGPTENTTFTCCHAMRHGDAIGSSVSIGRPISNTFVYLLNDGGQPVAPGEVGELCAGGDGIARGYLNSSELTGEKFVPDPLSSQPRGRMYRTGDLARWNSDGTIEFLGRRDSQVKILGHRIELGEIEAALGECPGIRQACVVAQNLENGVTAGKRLIAFYVADAHQPVSGHTARNFLSRTLPAYMLPGMFVPVDAFPLTPNGKIDRSALVIPAEANSEQRGPIQKKNELEEKIASLWKQVLGVSEAGLDENFFDLGGDSLLIVAIHSQLQKMFPQEIPVTDLFEYVTVRSLAAHLGANVPQPQSLMATQDQARKQREALSRKPSWKEIAT